MVQWIRRWNSDKPWLLSSCSMDLLHGKIILMPWRVKTSSLKGSGITRRVSPILLAPFGFVMWSLTRPKGQSAAEDTKTRKLPAGCLLLSENRFQGLTCYSTGSQSCWPGSTLRQYCINVHRPMLFSVWPNSGSMTSSGKAMPKPYSLPGIITPECLSCCMSLQPPASGVNGTMRFECTTKVLAKRMLRYCTIS